MIGGISNQTISNQQSPSTIRPSFIPSSPHHRIPYNGSKEAITTPSSVQPASGYPRSLAPPPSASHRPEHTDRLVGEALDLASTSLTLPTCTEICRLRPPRCACRRRPGTRRGARPGTRGRRDEVVLATKSNGIVGHGVNDRGLAPPHHPSSRDEPAPPGDRLYRPLLRPRPRPAHTAGADPRGVRRPDSRQGKLPRRPPITPPGRSPVPCGLRDDRRLNAPVAVQVKYNSSTGLQNANFCRPPASTSGYPSFPYALLHGGLLADLGVLDRLSPATNASRVPGSRAEIAIACESERLSHVWGLQPYQVSLTGCFRARRSLPVIVGRGPDRAARQRDSTPTSNSNRRVSTLTALASERHVYHRAGDGPELPPAPAGQLRPAEPLTANQPLARLQNSQSTKVLARHLIHSQRRQCSPDSELEAVSPGRTPSSHAAKEAGVNLFAAGIDETPPPCSFQPLAPRRRRRPWAASTQR